MKFGHFDDKAKEYVITTPVEIFPVSTSVIMITAATGESTEL